MLVVTLFVIAAFLNAVAAQTPGRNLLHYRNPIVSSTPITSACAAEPSVSAASAASGRLTVASTISIQVTTTLTVQKFLSVLLQDSRSTGASTSKFRAPPPSPPPPPQSCLSNLEALASCVEQSLHQKHPYPATSLTISPAISSSHIITFPLLPLSSTSNPLSFPMQTSTFSSASSSDCSVSKISPATFLSSSTLLNLAPTAGGKDHPKSGLSQTLVSSSSSFNPTTSSASQSEQRSSSISDVATSYLSQSQSLLVLSTTAPTASSGVQITTSRMPESQSLPDPRTSISQLLPSSLSFFNPTNTSQVQFSLTSKAPSIHSSQSELLPSSPTFIFPTTDASLPLFSLTSKAPSTHGSQTALTSSTSLLSSGPTTIPSPHSSPRNPSGITTSSLLSIVVGTQVITEDSLSHFRIGSRTLLPGSAITVDGERVSLAPSGNALIVNGATRTPGLPTTRPTSPNIIVVGSSTFTEDVNSNLVIGTQTLTRGGVITLDGQAVSLSPSGNGLVIDGKTAALATIPTTLATSFGSLLSEPPITSLEIAGQTLTMGGVITVGGDVLSLAPSGTGIAVVGTVPIGGSEGGAAATSAGGTKNDAGPRTQGGLSPFALFVLILGGFWLY